MLLLVLNLDLIGCYRAMICDLYTAAVALEETSDEICVFDLSDGSEKEVLIIHLTSFFLSDVHQNLFTMPNYLLVEFVKQHGVCCDVDSDHVQRALIFHILVSNCLGGSGALCGDVTRYDSELLDDVCYSVLQCCILCTYGTRISIFPFVAVVGCHWFSVTYSEVQNYCNA